MDQLPGRVDRYPVLPEIVPAAQSYFHGHISTSHISTGHISTHSCIISCLRQCGCYYCIFRCPESRRSYQNGNDCQYPDILHTKSKGGSPYIRNSRVFPIICQFFLITRRHNNVGRACEIRL